MNALSRFAGAAAFAYFVLTPLPAFAQATAALTVRVADELGQPRADVWVQALAVTDAPAGRIVARATIAASAFPQFGQKTFYTDDRGEVRIYGLPAGAYVIVASPRASPVFDGAWRERYAIYPSTYYPSTPRLSDAQIVQLRAGDDVQLGVLSLRTMPAPTIRGRVVRGDGSPARGAVVLSFNEESPLTIDRLITADYLRAELANGRFEFDHVPPGEYVIRTDDETWEKPVVVTVSVGSLDLTDVVLTRMQ